MESITWVMGLFASVCTLLGVTLQFVQAAPEHRRQTISFVAKTCAALFLIGISLFNAYACYLFLIADAPLTRVAVFIFALNFFNTLAYGNMLADFLVHLARKQGKAKAEEISQELQKARDDRLLSEANANTQQLLTEFMKDLLAAMRGK